MMRGTLRGFSILVLGIVVFSLGGCATCGTSYRRELTRNPDLAEANASYKKAIRWLDRAECSYAQPAEVQRCFTTAESYLSDTIYKLKELGHDFNIDVSEDVYYCEKMKTETDVKIGASDRTAQSPMP